MSSVPLLGALVALSEHLPDKSNSGEEEEEELILASDLKAWSMVGREE